MLKINNINCKIKDLTIAYSFALAIVSESTMTDNISMFWNFIINQPGLKKEDL